MDTAPGVMAPRSREELRFWMSSDLAAHGITEWRHSYRSSRPTAHYQVLRRRAEYWAFGSDHRMPRAVVERRAAWLAKEAQQLGHRLRLDVPLGTAGPGLFLTAAPDSPADRELSVQVHPDARLGSNCTLGPGVVIGMDHAAGRAPRLGDHCLLGERAVVVGAHLGDRVEVSADAVVRDDFGDDVKLLGQPARAVGVTGSATTRRDGRGKAMTADQSVAARRLHAAGMDTCAIADAFWVSHGAVASALAPLDDAVDGKVVSVQHSAAS